MNTPPFPSVEINDDVNVTVSDAGGNDVKRSALVCFSHLRWNFVYQRPQHLMTRLAANFDVLFWEEPIFVSGGGPALEARAAEEGGVTVLTPQLPSNLSEEEQEVALHRLLKSYTRDKSADLVKWYYTPMMLPFSRDIAAKCTVYDCMDELSNFLFAPKKIQMLEVELLGLADVVFTGGHSLFEAKQGAHENIHLFPSSVDQPHFSRARSQPCEPVDQRRLPGPRLGYYGVVDERIDLGLIADVADARPDWTLVIVGPVVKIDQALLPRRRNIAYLGVKDYADLPDYLSGWDVAIMPFAINEATRFISPTKTPEYLAGGRPVVSTRITDVERQYGHLDGVIIADDPAAFVRACERALALPCGWIAQADEALAGLSWDRTAQDMARLIGAARDKRAARSAAARAVKSARRDPSRHYDYMIVGAGFAGSVLAERLARGSGKRVLLIDRRPHIGGNAYDCLDEAGVLIHQYGPHIFHTNAEEIVDYLSRFTQWRPYEHRVLANLGDQMVPMPINRTTINRLYGLSLRTDEDAKAFLAARATPMDTIRNAADAVISQVGQDLYETFFRGYTRKQWGMDPADLDKSVTARVPARFNEDDRYFTDKFQCMPAQGYTAMFERMLAHENIDVRVGLDYNDAVGEVSFGHLIFTGRIDDYFGRRYGELPYRSLKFERVTLDRDAFQPVGTVNYPSESTPYTRITEFKHLTGQTHDKTTVTYEYPCAEGEPYYPVPRSENQALFKRYEMLAMNTPDVTFVGRLATYRYYNMDQVVGQALSIYRRLAREIHSEPGPALKQVGHETTRHERDAVPLASA
jgi:UDP-galactopyranose mutase